MRVASTSWSSSQPSTPSSTSTIARSALPTRRTRTSTRPSFSCSSVGNACSRAISARARSSLGASTLIRSATSPLQLPGRPAGSASPRRVYGGGAAVSTARARTCGPSQARDPALLVDDLAYALLDLVARLPRLLLDLVDDLVRVASGFVDVLVGQLLELLDELRLQVVEALLDLLLEHVVESHRVPPLVGARCVSGFARAQTAPPRTRFPASSGHAVPALCSSHRGPHIFLAETSSICSARRKDVHACEASPIGQGRGDEAHLRLLAEPRRSDCLSLLWA